MDENKVQDFEIKLENNIVFLNTKNINDSNLSIDTLTCNLTNYLHENAMNSFDEQIFSKDTKYYSKK